MMLRNLVMNAFRVRYKSITANYRLALGHNDVDGVHDLRVDLKRMRALFATVESLNGRFRAGKQFKPFRMIGRNTGVLRDAQVQREMLASLTEAHALDVDVYVTFLREREEEGWQIFRRFAGTDTPLKTLKAGRAAVESAFDSLDDTVALTRAQGYFYNLTNELIILTRGNALREAVLHDIRKLAKTVHYTLEIIGPAFPGFTEADVFTGAVKKLHQELGAWHDYDVSRRYVEHFLDARGIDTDTGPYAVLVSELARRRRERRDAIPAVFAAFNEVASEL